MSTVSLSIDYSNGEQKTFSSIAWKENLTIIEAVESTAQISPGTSVQFGSDRSGHVLGLEIDGMPAAGTAALQWMVWVNEKLFEHRLGTETSFSFFPAEREANLLQPGDHVRMKLSAKEESVIS